jgi:Zn-dependent protease with chaperone function
MSDPLINARFFDGITAKSRAVQIHKDFKKINLLDPEDLTFNLSLPFTCLKIDTIQNGTVFIYDKNMPCRYLELTEDTYNMSFKTLFKVKHEYSKKNIKLDANTFLYFIGSIIFLYLSYNATNFISKKIAAKIPMSWEIQFSSNLSSLLKDQLCQTTNSEKILNTILTRLLTPEEIQSIPYKINIIAEDQITNAFAFPGGQIILLDGLIRRTQTPEELIGVIAHEIQHVKKRHITRQLVRATLMSSIWTSAFGDYTGILVVDPKTAIRLLSLSFSKEDEQEADDEGVALLNRAGISASDYAKFFTRIETSNNKYEPILSTHPSSQHRIEKINQLNTVWFQKQQVLSDLEWSELRLTCRDTINQRPKEKKLKLFK